MNDPDDSLLETLITNLIEELSLESQTRAVNLDENERRVLETVLVRLIGFRLNQLNEQVNEDLFKECIARSGDESLDEFGASAFILKELWKRLRETHELRIVE
ncbi:MAG: hypothetical protein PVF79_08145 [Desulfobacterales bacterium]|jgi:hypothetical protein